MRGQTARKRARAWLNELIAGGEAASSEAGT